MRKYINIWLPDCPFEVSTTNRYTIVTHEAATTARRFIKKNQTIKYLSGYLVSMTAEEEEDLDLTRRDFSIVMSSRKKSPSLFLGPARFANHDCNANARLATQGPDGMQVVAVRDIQLGEEITVTYGDSYFGENNCECLCMTCEKEERNGWSPCAHGRGPSGTITPPESEMDATRPYLFRKARNSTRITRSSVSASPDTDRGRSRKRRKMSDIGTLSSPSSEIPGKTESARSALRHEFLPFKSVAQSDSQPAHKEQSLRAEEYRSENMKGEDALRESVRAAFASAKSSTVQRTRKRKRKDNMNWLERAAPMTPENCVGTLKLPETPQESPSISRCRSAQSYVDSIFDRDAANSSSPVTTPSAGLSDSWKAPLTTPDLDTASDSELSELSNNEELDDVHMTITRKPKLRKKRNRKPKIIPTIEETSPPVVARVPGDYVRTPLLLGETYTRWVDCRTCSTCWVQPNGYLTRKECPRCERHSKLYGYQWPKTEKAGKDNDEERVMDHRTVHRFICPTEEAQIKKRFRGAFMADEELTGEGIQMRRGGSYSGSPFLGAINDFRRHAG